MALKTKQQIIRIDLTIEDIEIVFRGGEKRGKNRNRKGNIIGGDGREHSLKPIKYIPLVDSIEQSNSNTCVIDHETKCVSGSLFQMCTNGHRVCTFAWDLWFKDKEPDIPRTCLLCFAPTTTVKIIETNREYID